MVKYNSRYSQQEDTGTLMASTTHTMSIVVRQMVAGLLAESRSGPDWFPESLGSCGVKGSLLTLELSLSGGIFNNVPKLPSLEWVPVSVTLLLEERASLVMLAGIFVPPIVFAELLFSEKLAATVGEVTLFVSECSVVLKVNCVVRLGSCDCDSIGF